MEMRALSLRMPPNHIAMFKAIIESFDNLATLRTEDPGAHRLRLSFAAEAAEDIDEMLAALTEQFAIERVE